MGHPFHWKRLMIVILLAMFFLIQPKTRAEDWSNRLEMRVYDGFMRREIKTWNGLEAGGGNYSCMFLRSDVQGTITGQKLEAGTPVYCVEPGTSIHNNAQMTASPDGAQNLTELTNPTLTNEGDIEKMIGRILLYGGNWHWGGWVKPMAQGGGLETYLATQALIWETVIGERDETFTHIAKPTWAAADSQNAKELYSGIGTYATTFQQEYARIEMAVQNHMKRPSFTYATAVEALDNTRRIQNRSVTLDDANEIVSSYQFIAQGCQIDSFGNSLRITLDEANDSVLATGLKQSAGNTEIPLLWTTSTAGERTQTCITPAGTGADTVSAYVALQLSTGDLEIEKVTKNNDGKRDGFTFGVFADEECLDQIDTLISDQRGIAAKTGLLPGTYWIKEIGVPQEFIIACDNPQKVVIEGEKTAAVAFQNIRKRGEIILRKINRNPELGEYSLQGAVYGLYAAETIRDANGKTCFEVGQEVDRATTDEAGIGKFTNIRLGRYYVKELTAPSGYILDTTPYDVVLSAEDGQEEILRKRIDCYEYPQTGQIFLSKYSADNAVTTENLSYSLAGAEFRVYRDAECTVQADVLITDEEGKATSANLPLGTYYVKEIHASPGYQVSDEAYVVKLQYGGQTVDLVKAHLNIPQKPQYGQISIIKQDSETGSEPQGDADLGGAVYEIHCQEPDGELVETIQAGEGETIAYSSDALPLGTYYVIEKQPPQGYTLNSEAVRVEVAYEGELVEIARKQVCIQDRVIQGKISLTKFADTTLAGPWADRKPLQGVMFGIYRKSDNTEITTMKTNEMGYAQSDWLPYGRYCVREIQPLEGYGAIEDFDVEIREDQKIYYYILENQPIQSYVRIEKRDTATGEVIPAAGAKFQLVNEKTGEEVRYKIYYPKEQWLCEFETDDSGTLTLPGPLGYGRYLLYEKEAPDGYILNENPIQFSVEADIESPIVVSFYDQVAKGDIEIVKTGDVLSDTYVEETEYGLLYHPIYEERGLEGASFEIIAAEDIYTPDHTKQAVKGEIVDTITTGVDGRAKSRKLYLGRYLVREITAPSGFVRDAAVYTVELQYQDQTTEVITEMVAMENRRQRAIVQVEKAAEQVIWCENGPRYKYEPGEGFVFGLYAAQNYLSAQKKTSIIPKDSLVDILITGQDGIAKSKTDLPLGEYYLKELDGPSGYRTADTTYNVEASYRGADTSEFLVTPRDEGGETMQIENELIKKRIQVLKVEDGGETGLEGAEYQVRTLDGMLIETLKTDERGSALSTYLPLGEYELIEVTPPPGFVVDSQVSQVSLDIDSPNITTIHRVNHPTTWKILKADALTGKALEGAELEILDERGQSLMCQTTDSSGLVEITGLLPGRYTFREIRQPNGYQLDVGVYHFWIDEDGGGHGDSLLFNQPVEWTIRKMDTCSSEPLAGARIRIKAMSNGETIEKVTDAEGRIHLQHLLEGVYTFQEIRQPDGYRVDPRRYQFEVYADGTVKGVNAIWNEPAVWRIWKQDQQTGKGLQGAKIALYDSHGVQLLTVETNEEGYVEFAYLMPGRYYFCEIVAPPDYQLNDATYQFEVLEDGRIQGDSIVFNDKIINPKTGDSDILARTVLLGLGMMVAIGGIIALKIRSRRRRNPIR